MFSEVSIHLLLLVATLSHAQETFPSRIPNWEKVSDRCNASSGQLDPFSKEFKVANFSWTEDLCRGDSDEDGRTNGQELGDPHCTWKPGQDPNITANITHPGICDPVESAVCRQKNIACGYHNPQSELPSVQNHSFFFNETKVPTAAHSTFCQAFRFPSKPTQLVAVRPLLNSSAIQSFQMFVCFGRIMPFPLFNSHPCSMPFAFCNRVLAGWTKGSSGEMWRNGTGFPVGNKTYNNFFILKAFYVNPKGDPNVVDASGVELTFDSTTLVNSSVLTLSQDLLDLPPGQREVSRNMTCSAAFSAFRTKKTIFLTHASPHMHSAGRTLELLHKRNGILVRRLLLPPHFSDVNPKRYHFDPPVEYHPGDSMFLNCSFSTLDRTRVTKAGLGPKNEMCAVYLSYFPKQPIELCTNFGEIHPYALQIPKFAKLGNCSAAAFLFKFLPQHMHKLQEWCDYSIDVCRTRCMQLVKNLNQHPCMQGFAHRFLFSLTMRFPLVAQLRLHTQACQAEIAFHERRKTLRKKKPQRQHHSNFQVGLLAVAVILGALFIACIVFLLRRAAASIKKKKEAEQKRSLQLEKAESNCGFELK